MFAVGTRVRCTNYFRSTYMQLGTVVRPGMSWPGGVRHDVVVKWDEGGKEEERNPQFLDKANSVKPFVPGMVVEIYPIGGKPERNPYRGRLGMVTGTDEATFVLVTVEGQYPQPETWQKNKNMSGWYPESLKYLNKEATTMAFSIGDTVRFTSGPFKETEAVVNHLEQQGQLIWVTLPSGEKSGAWFPSRFVLVAKRDNPQEVEAVKSNNAQTYQVALQGLRRLVEAGITGVSLRPRSWDTKGLYAAIEVAEKDGVKKLYTPEQVENYLAALKPIDSIGDKRTWGWHFRTEKGNTIYNPSGSPYWTEEEITQVGGRVAQGGKFYRLCRNVPTPFVS